MDELFGNRAKSLLADFFKSMGGENNFGPALNTYGRILKEFYDANTYFAIPRFTIKKFDEELKINRYFDVIIDQRFVDIFPKEKLKKLSKDQVDHLSNNFYNMELLFKQTSIKPKI